MHQFSGFATAAETNRRYHYLLKNGQTGLSVAFDMPTLMGQDSDAITSRGEVGHCGVALASLADMPTLFDDLPFRAITTSMPINSPAAHLPSRSHALPDPQRVPPTAPKYARMLSRVRCTADTAQSSAAAPSTLCTPQHLPFRATGLRRLPRSSHASPPATRVPSPPPRPPRRGVPPPAESPAAAASRRAWGCTAAARAAGDTVLRGGDRQAP